MNTYPIHLGRSTYSGLIVEDAQVVGSYTRRDPLREELAMGLKLHVGAGWEWVDDSEVLGTVIDGRGRGALGHDSDASIRAVWWCGE